MKSNCIISTNTGNKEKYRGFKPFMSETNQICPDNANLRDSMLTASNHPWPALIVRCLNAK